MVSLDRNIMQKKNNKGPRAGVSGQPGNPASYAPDRRQLGQVQIPKDLPYAYSGISFFFVQNFV